MTTDRDDPLLKEHHTEGYLRGQQKAYLVLSQEEIAKGFLRPVRMKYTHLLCGSETKMGLSLCETYARNPKFYGGTFCCSCCKHFPLQSWNEKLNKVSWNFEWVPDGDPVGSNQEEALQYLQEKSLEEVRNNNGSGI